MKLIIAGSRTLTDYQLLCQVLAPDRHRITQVLTGGARRRSARLSLGVEASGQASALSRRLGALREKRWRAPQLPDGAGRRPAPGVLGWALCRHASHDQLHAAAWQTRRGHPRRGYDIKKRLARVQALLPSSRAPQWLMSPVSTPFDNKGVKHVYDSITSGPHGTTTGHF